MADPPSNYPEPIVYGPDFPQFKMLMRGGRQVFESRTNQNLFLEREDFISDFTGAGTFTMAKLLRKVSTWSDCAGLIFDLIGADDQFFDWIGVHDQPQWEACPACADLLGYCDSTAQRAFLLSWWRTQYTEGFEKAWDRWMDWLRRVGEARGMTIHDVVAGRGGNHAFIFSVVDLLFDFPALIPEVWLNYVGYERTAADEEHLAENAQRVDFVMLSNGQKCVIEIDGPSHYADYDTAERKYEVNESLYAKNLKIERTFRRQGWEIHRFANVEVKDVSDDAFTELVEHLPGYTANSFMGRPVVTAEQLRDAMGDASKYLVPA